MFSPIFSNLRIFSSKIPLLQIIEPVRFLSNNKAITRVDYFQSVAEKTKDSYLEMIDLYKQRERLRRGHVEFIYSALRHMKEFNVEKDLEVYKSLIDVFPKGKMIPKNMIQAEFMHYPKHQQCAIDLLEQMEENAVMPDWEMESQLLNVFGSRGYPLRRYWRMMYWFPKMMNASPWPLPRPVPNDSLLLAELALERINSVDINAEISVLKTSNVEDSIDDTWIVSGQSPDQKQLLTDLKEESLPLYVEGGFNIWIRDKPITYFVLRANLPSEYKSADPEPSEDIMDDVSSLSFGLWSHPGKIISHRQRPVHVQEEGIILATCATGTSSRDSLLSWIRLLSETNPRLTKIPVVFALQSSSEHLDPDLLPPETPALPR